MYFLTKNNKNEDYKKKKNIDKIEKNDMIEKMTWPEIVLFGLRLRGVANFVSDHLIMDHVNNKEQTSKSNTRMTA